MNPSLLPLVIFFAEVCVVTLCTVRIIFLSQRQKVLAMIFGAFEVSIWLFAIGKVMQNLSNPFCSIAFAGGFAIGNYLGVVIEQKLALGNLVVRIITHKNSEEIVECLKTANYGLTRLDAQGAKGPVQLILTVIPRKELQKVVTLIKSCDENVFYSVDDLQSATSGVFPEGRERMKQFLPSLLRGSWTMRFRAFHVVYGAAKQQAEV